MKINAKKRFLSWMIAFLMVFTYVPATAYAAETESEISVLDGQVLITNTAGTGSVDGDSVIITAPGAFPGQPVANVIKIYNKADKAATLSFDYVAENYKEDGFSEKQDRATYTIVLEPEQFATLSITGKRTQQGDGTAVLTLKNFNLDFAAEVSEVKLSYEESLGDVKVGGESVESETVKAVTYAEGASLEAIPAEGNEFLGWVNKDTRKIISREPVFTLKPVKDMNVEAVFSGPDSETYYLVGKEYLIDSFNEAITKATGLADKTVVLMKSTVLQTGTYTIPDGVTFLVPFNKENTLYTMPSMEANMAVWGKYEEPTPFCTLTLAEGTNLIVNGELSLSAHHYAANGGGRASGGPTGPVSFIDTEKNSKIIVGNGGSLYAYGYITGEGTVTARNGASIYELFQVEDFRGGGATATIAINNNDKGVLPLTQYYVQNIEVPLTLEAGAMEYVYTSFFMTQSAIGSAVPFIGDENSMFNITNGSVTKTYDGFKDRLLVEADGSMILSPITVEFSGSPLNSKMFELAINSNISVKLNSGEFVIKQDIAMLPGSEIFIEEDAVCTLAEDVNIYVYDADQWGGYVGSNNSEFIPIRYAPGKVYDRTKEDFVDAAVKVNGIFDATKGYVYTTIDPDSKEGNANIYSTGNGVVELVAGEQEHTYQFTQEGTNGEFHEIYLNPANLKNADNTYLQTNAGKYTYVDIAWQCEHDITNEEVIKEPSCKEAGIKLVTCEFGDQYKALVPALGHKEVIDPAVEGSCTVDAKTEGSHCDVCGEVIVKQIVTPAPGHTEVVVKGKPATCTESGISDEVYCFVCDEILAVKEVIDPLGHDWVVEGTEPTCTTPGFGSSKCNRCDETVQDSIIPALGHSYDWTTVKEPECEQPGIRAGKCSRDNCGHETVEPIAPTGHVVKKVDSENATCTKDGHEEYWQCRICAGMFEQESCEVEFAGIPVIKAHGHNPERISKVEATCTKDGNEEYYICGICEMMFADIDCEEELTEIPVIPATGHEPQKTDAKPATCTEDGHEEYWTCENCNLLFADEACENELEKIEVIPATGHAMSVIEGKAVTCTEDGNSEYWQCGNCNGIYADEAGKTELAEIPVIKAGGHNISKVEAKAETCTEDGHEEYWLCIACGFVFGDEACSEELAEIPVIKAKGHNVAVTEAKAPTCTDNGNEIYWTCENCSRIFADEACSTEYDSVPVLKALGHKPKHTTAKAATCEEDGYGEYCICKTCDTLFADSECTEELDEIKVIPATGHSFGDWTVVSEATCTEDGREIRTCSACGKEESNIITATGHEFGTEEKYQTPAEDVDGGWYVECECGEKAWTAVEKYAEYLKAETEAVDVELSAKADQKENFVELTLSNDGELEDYKLYRSETGKNGKFEFLADVTENVYLDYAVKEGKTYHYYAVGCLYHGEEIFTTAGSNKVTAKIEKEPVPVKEAKMYIRSYYAGKGIKLTWSDPRVEVDGYEIYRTDKMNGTYKKVKTINDGDVRQWTNTGLKLQKRYYYKVRGFNKVNGKKVYTQYSKAGYRYVLNARNAGIANAIDKSDSITAKKAVKANGGIKVTWTKKAAVKCTKYEIWRSTAKDGTYTKIATTRKMSYNDTKNLKQGKRYYYKVVGYRYFGKACPQTKASNVVSAVK